jgi:hypothetical protein
MITIAAKMLGWLIIATILGFVWAWLWRGARDQKQFDQFFSEWKLRYDQLEHDYYAQSQEAVELKRRLAASTAQADTAPIETAQQNPDNQQVAA